MSHKNHFFVYKTYNISPLALILFGLFLIAAIFFLLPVLLIAVCIAIIIGGYLIWRTNKMFRRMEEDIFEQMSKEYKYEDPDVIDISADDIDDDISDNEKHFKNSKPFLPGPSSK